LLFEVDSDATQSSPIASTAVPDTTRSNMPGIQLFAPRLASHTPERRHGGVSASPLFSPFETRRSLDALGDVSVMSDAVLQGLDM
jgi:hypothetical protein